MLSSILIVLLWNHLFQYHLRTHFICNTLSLSEFYKSKRTGGRATIPDQVTYDVLMLSVHI